MSPYTAYRVRCGGRVFSFPSLEHPSWRFNAHPDGLGTDWEEDLDVDRPHGLDYRAWNHLAKAYRKRNDKEHAAIGDGTAGGEHVPGFAQVLRQVDGTADVTAAYDATLFQANGLVHSSGNQSLWCITGAGGDPTICGIDPDTQCKGADLTWTGAQQFDASVDMTILHVDASLTVTGAALLDGTTNIHGACDMSDTQIDGTLTVLDRTDVSDLGVSGDASFAGAAEFDGAVQIDGSVQVNGPMSFGANNVYDSSWFDCSLKGTYTKTHDLSSTALLVSVYFKDVGNGLGLGADRIYSPHFDYNAGEESGAAVVNLTATQLTVQAGADNVIRTWDGDGLVADCNSGQYRIVAMRLV